MLDYYNLNEEPPQESEKLISNDDSEDIGDPLHSSVWLYSATRNPSCNPEIERYYYYSPALKETKPGSKVTHLNHTKWSPFSPSSLNRLEDVDSNWTAILRVPNACDTISDQRYYPVGMISFSEEELLRMGGSPDSMRLPPESGGGLHPDYYQTRSVVWNQSVERRTSHWDHCIETLRQYVTCNADTTVLTHSWFEGFERPVAFNENPRRCADWDAHFRWQVDRQAPAPHHPISKPPDAIELPLLPISPPSGYMSMYSSG
ncbi:hypothetical protein Daesc_007817 [Daldinia eschscholtzii]|uniref:Uncharacterized protein n=1 Tax=Daldinia eschscholtzii TaxID=292717 RepID=A0AAX6MFQ6_9PEZI